MRFLQRRMNALAQIGALLRRAATATIILRRR